MVAEKASTVQFYCALELGILQNKSKQIVGVSGHPLPPYNNI